MAMTRETLTRKKPRKLTGARVGFVFDPRITHLSVRRSKLPKQIERLRRPPQGLSIGEEYHNRSAYRNTEGQTGIIAVLCKLLVVARAAALEAKNRKASFFGF